MAIGARGQMRHHLPVPQQRLGIAEQRLRRGQLQLHQPHCPRRGRPGTVPASSRSVFRQNVPPAPIRRSGRRRSSRPAPPSPPRRSKAACSPGSSSRPRPTPHPETPLRQHPGRASRAPASEGPGLLFQRVCAGSGDARHGPGRRARHDSSGSRAGRGAWRFPFAGRGDFCGAAGPVPKGNAPKTTARQSQMRGCNDVS